eukprot:GGOE01021748.1.p1 GENE.GGOE01021748.1~~GGOE01021748.1.p1  ORF type:complete len:432 (-),score=113.83 GGOE01021748.1:650-1903(-)
METIVNIPDHLELPSAGTLPGELPAPPPARLAHPDPSVVFDEVTKPAPVPTPPPQPRRGRCLRLGLALALVAGCCFAFGDPPLPPDARELAGPGEELTVNDPMNDLHNVFIGQGVEPSDPTCLPCFFRDTGRVRRAARANDAFIAFKSDKVLSSFAVHTHVFHPHPGMAAGVGPMPFTFWTAGDNDQDGQPDQWDQVVPQYRDDGNALGWERGVFFSGLPSTNFLKIVFHDVQGTWRPQVGHVQLVRLVAHGQQPDTALPQAAEPAMEMEDTDAQEEEEEEGGPLDAAVTELIRMIASMDVSMDAEPADHSATKNEPAAKDDSLAAKDQPVAKHQLVLGDPTTDAGSQEPVLRVVGNMRPNVVLPAVQLTPAQTALLFPETQVNQAAQSLPEAEDEMALSDRPNPAADAVPILVAQA